MSDNKQFVILGNKNPEIKPKKIFDEGVIDFLDQLSKIILKNKKKILFPEIISFGFWCRKNNINNFKKNYQDDILRLGKGKIFHITPKNVPINFAYSLSVGLLSGNHNIVRVHSKNCEITNTICELIKKIFKKKKYSIYKNYIQVINYESSSELTEKYSLECDSRIIWGGDDTVNSIKKMKTKPDSADIAFPDRFSLSLINAGKLNNLNLKDLVSKFYNDTYIMDQSACSSPHLIIWLNHKKKSHLIKKFWDEVFKLVEKKYSITEYLSFNKLQKSNENLIILNKNVIDFKNYSNLIHLTEIKNLDYKLEDIRGLAGSFYNIFLKNINSLKDIKSDKFQTLTYFGFEKKFLKELAKNNFFLGVNRICPLGRALNFSIFWDGKDLVQSLSRVINIE
tara:strand:- start:464 stop:1648 length:1185 start_codon:yes stop_codon:yes gene_type:complete